MLRNSHLHPAALGLLLLLLLQSGGMFVFYSVQQGIHQYRMMRKIETETNGFETLRLSYDHYVKSLVETNEVRLNGHMFDIRSVRHFNDSVELVARRDHKEERILLAIRSFLPGQLPPHRKVPEYLLKLLNQHYVPAPLFSFDALSAFIQIVRPIYTQPLARPFIGFASPPPEC